MKAWSLYIFYIYSIFLKEHSILSKPGKHTPCINYTKGCLIPDSRVNIHRKNLNKGLLKTKETKILFSQTFGNIDSGFHLILTIILCNNF